MGAWEQLRGEFATSTDRNFERLVLPLLKLFWPDIIRPPEKDHLDTAGIDLVVFADSGPFPCVVQCKGLYSQAELEDSHYRQIKKSIDSFINSDYSCIEYVLIHNRVSNNRKVVQKIESELARIIDNGKAKTTRIWDRQTFAQNCRQQLTSIMRDRLREESRRILDEAANLFLFGAIYVPTVPVSQHQIALRAGMSPDIIDTVESADYPISQLVLSPTEARWTLLLGQYGTGKSTAALRSAERSTTTVIYSRCVDMGEFRGGLSTNLLLEHVSRSLRLFEEFDDEARNRLERLAGPTLNYLLRRNESSEVLILDGLDENRSFSTPLGMKDLSSSLAELSCPIILTTRQEHFDATFGNFEYILNHLSKKGKGGASRLGRMFRLENWGDSQVEQFITEAIKLAAEDQKPRLQALFENIRRGSAPVAQELLYNPLFLQMTIELVATGNLIGKSPGEVINRWVERKIARDLGVARSLPIAVANVSSFIDQMMTVMERIASKMIDTKTAQVELTEEIDSLVVTTEAAKIFKAATVDISSIVGCSVLVPVTQRRKTNVPIKFSHRVFQEFFLARHYNRHRLSTEALPDSVRVLHADIVLHSI